jgi:hypothetical protein
MAEAIYLLCILTSLACAWLLLRSYKRTGYRLLFWSGLCFAAMTFNNVMLLLDKIVLPQVDLMLWRLGSALVAVSLLLYGLITERD